MQLDVCCFKEKGTSETFLQLSWRCLRSDTGNLPMRNKSPYYDIIHTPDSVLWLQLGVFLGSSSHRFMSLHFYFVVWITPGLRVLYLSSFHRHRLDARVCVRMTPPGVLLRAKPSAATSAKALSAQSIWIAPDGPRTTRSSSPHSRCAVPRWAWWMTSGLCHKAAWIKCYQMCALQNKIYSAEPGSLLNVLQSAVCQWFNWSSSVSPPCCEPFRIMT